ncbi:cytochrome c oxidase subunit 7C, mitochondrial-like [Cotesia glomerata]|uniref:cytochrome c oxidase subunit 7C, mitochondrial-like n=1 Tax=Cotesia glomerata TaxID=32391 RepID=UPI001D019AF8|nr:cytochrome c oxidase subunit 7C, mitochondrial-like [Cotesia glomerata]
MIARQLIAKQIRNFTTSAIRRSGHGDPGGYPGANLPFSIHNRFKLTAYFIIFFGSGLALPFIIVRHQMLK